MEMHFDLQLSYVMDALKKYINMYTMYVYLLTLQINICILYIKKGVDIYGSNKCKHSYGCRIKKEI